MGGFGSGRRGGWGRDTVEEHRSIEVGALHRAGVLADGWHGGWGWWCDGERTADIVIAGGRHRITLSYRARSGGGPYLVCPRCHRSVLRLHGFGIRFLCRSCHCLAYACQNEREHHRALRRANRLRVRLGGDPGMASFVAPRPKGMHGRTYDRMVERIELLERTADDYAARLFLRLEKRVGRSRSFWP